MKCECGAKKVSSREAYRYDECGLPNVTLVGVEIRRCPSCGDISVIIPKIEELHRAIASTLVSRPRRLAGVEIRFLRKLLGLSSADFAQKLNVTRETVSRWENGAMLPEEHTDRLIRLMAMLLPPTESYAKDELAKLITLPLAEATTDLMAFERGRSGWNTSALAS